MIGGVIVVSFGGKEGELGVVMVVVGDKSIMGFLAGEHYRYYIIVLTVKIFNVKIIFF